MRAAYWASEGVRLRLRGEAVPELLNDMALAGIPFYRAEMGEDGAVTLLIRGDGAARVLALAKERQVEAEVLSRRGLASFLRRFRGHLGLLLAPVLLFAAVLWLSDYIWEIDVEGNRSLGRTEILSALEELGVGIGHSGLHIDNELTRSKMQEKLGKLSYLTVRVNGSRATVLVRERREPPEMVDEALPTDVIARRTGLIERMSVLEGRAEVKRGDAVLAGETLITGGLTDLQGETREVHAMGDVWARVWYAAEALLPLEHTEKRETGEQRLRWAVKICNFRLNLYFDGGISYEAYDKIQGETRFRLLGSYLPIALVRTEYREYVPVSCTLDRETGETLLQERMLAWLREVSGCEEPSVCSFASALEEGALRVSMSAECVEQIGVAVER